MHVARTNPGVVLPATQWDITVVEAWRSGNVHPALGLGHPTLACRAYEEWDADVGRAETVIVAVSSDGLRPVLADAIPRARGDATWIIATKGWQPDTLESPCDVASGLLGGGERVVSLAGPGLTKALSPFIENATRQRGAALSIVRGKGRAKVAAERPYEISDLREWAGKNKISVPARGRIPAAVVEQYLAAGRR